MVLSNLINSDFDISSYISSSDEVVKCDSDDTLGSVLPLVQSGHSPLLVFKGGDEFVGLVSPYQALYKNKYPYTTKVSSIALMPPHITKNTKLFDVATYMLESRLYILPVFGENKEIIGIVDSKDIFKNLIANQYLLTLITSALKHRAPVTTSIDASVGDIFQMMKDRRSSRIVLVDDGGILAGIVSRKDLHGAFMKPTEKQRFGKSGLQPTDRAFDAEKEYRKSAPVKNFATKLVFSLPFETEPEEIVKQLATSDHNSVVLVDSRKKPVGFLSMRDILIAIRSLSPEEKINLIFRKPASNVSEKEIEQVEETLTNFGKKMSKRMTLDRIEVSIEQPKTQAGGSIIFNTLVILAPVSGAQIISKTKNRSFVAGVNSAIAQIEKQERRGRS
jgi:CBS domain-containing protein/ribosome-associated translation inhibitor RaiA